MAEDTNRDAAAEELSMDEQLNAAAADAVGQAETESEEYEAAPEVEQEAAAEEPEQEEQVDEDGLPVDHGARSDLGRKVAAYHRRMDEFEGKLGKIDQFDARLDKLLSVLEKTAAEPEEEIDPDMPMTYRDFQKYQEMEEQRRTQSEQAYNNNYVSKIVELSRDVDKEYYDEVIREMNEMRYTPTNDPARDAEVNFLKAEKILLRKKMAKPAGKKNPLEGNQSDKVAGTITGQTVTKKDMPLPKLDPAAADYLAYVKHRDGEEAALKMHKGLAAK